MTPPPPTLTAVFATPLGDGDARRAFRFFLIDVDEERAGEIIAQMDAMGEPSAGATGREQVRTENDPVDLVTGTNTDALPLELQAALRKSLRERHAIELAARILPDEGLRQPSRVTRHVTRWAAFWSTDPDAGAPERTVPLPRWMLHRYLLRMGPAENVPARFMELLERNPDVAAHLLERGLHPDVGDGDVDRLIDRLGEDDLMTLLSHADSRIRKHAIISAGNYREGEPPAEEPRTR